MGICQEGTWHQGPNGEGGSRRGPREQQCSVKVHVSGKLGTAEEQKPGLE